MQGFEMTGSVILAGGAAAAGEASTWLPQLAAIDVRRRRGPGRTSRLLAQLVAVHWARVQGEPQLQRSRRKSGRRSRVLEARASGNRLAGAQNQDHFVLVRFEARCPPAITRFATTMSQFLDCSLAARLLDQVLGLGGEADQEPVALLAAHLGQDVRRRIEFQREPRGGLLDLLLRRLRDVIVGDGGGLDDDGGLVPDAPSRPRAFRRRCLTRISLDARGRGQMSPVRKPGSRGRRGRAAASASA